MKLDDEQRLAAFVVLKPGSEFDALALRTRLAAHLPEWKIPAARLYRLQSLPTPLSRGKSTGSGSKPRSGLPRAASALL